MKGIMKVFVAIASGYLLNEAVKRISTDQTDKPQIDQDDILRDYPPSNNEHEFYMDYPFKLAYVCDHCGEMAIVHQSDRLEKQTIEMLRECDGIICEYCDGFNEFDDYNYETLHR